jgi:hypothetical protein
MGQDKAPAKPEAKAGGPPGEAEMAMMMELAKPGENHKLLAQGAGTWDYTVKFWMSPDPNAPPSEATGTAVLKTVMDGRYLVGDHASKMQMPGPDGKPMDMDFKGMSIEGYDNASKKFVSSWIDNMGTGIMNSEGDYDAATKTFTYRAEVSMMPGTKTKIRQVIKIDDKDHHTFEFYEDRGGKEVRTMVIKYTRKG